MSNDVKMPRPMVWDELFPNRWLKAGLMKGRDVTLTIRDVTLEKLPEDNGGEKVHGILAFEKTERNMEINKTNGLCLRAMFGADLSKWPGKRVTLFPTTDKFGGETVDAIRVRGSPDIERTLTIVIKFKKKKPKTIVLVKTDPKAQTNATPEPEQPATATADEPPPGTDLPTLSDQPAK